MTTTQQQTAPEGADENKRVSIRLDVTIELKGAATIFTALDQAKELIAKAREVGSVEGHVTFGRQKFPLA